MSLFGVSLMPSSVRSWFNGAENNQPNANPDTLDVLHPDRKREIAHLFESLTLPIDRDNVLERFKALFQSESTVPDKDLLKDEFSAIVADKFDLVIQCKTPEAMFAEAKSWCKQFYLYVAVVYEYGLHTAVSSAAHRTEDKFRQCYLERMQAKSNQITALIQKNETNFQPTKEQADLIDEVACMAFGGESPTISKGIALMHKIVWNEYTCIKFNGKHTWECTAETADNRIATSVNQLIMEAVNNYFTETQSSRT